MVADAVLESAGGVVVPDAVAYAWAATPAITAITPDVIGAARSTGVTITGNFSAFVTTAGSTACVPTMEFRSSDGQASRTCGNLTVTATAATCTLFRSEGFGADQQQQSTPQLTLCTAEGTAVYAHPEPAVARVDVGLRVTSVTPAEGSIAGGTILTLRGVGFATADETMLVRELTRDVRAPMLSVALVAAGDCSVPCAIATSNFTTVVCTVARALFPCVSRVGRNGTVSANVSVTMNGYAVPCQGAEDTCVFTTPAVADSPRLLSLDATDALVVVHGVHLQSTPRVYLGLEECSITSANASVIVCVPPVLPAGKYPVQVSFDSFGWAAQPMDVSAHLVYESSLAVTSLHPRLSSVGGGRLVTMRGRGFATQRRENTVRVGGAEAHVVHSNTSMVVFVTPSAIPRDHTCASTECLTDGTGWRKFEPCVFPFIHDGQLHHTCTNHGHETFWCATEVNSAGRARRWGNCGCGYSALRLRVQRNLHRGPRWLHVEGCRVLLFFISSYTFC